MQLCILYFKSQVLQLINERPNICKQIHLPAQSGNNEVLKNMRRGYTIEAYIELVEKIRGLIPGMQHWYKTLLLSSLSHWRTHLCNIVLFILAL